MKYIQIMKKSIWRYEISEDIPEQLATITFIEYEGKTKLTALFQFASSDDLKTTLDMGMVEGLTMTLSNLAKQLKEIQI